MTVFEIMVPVAALAVALIGTTAFHVASKRWDARLKAEHRASQRAK